jgi:heat shock protein HslJ
MKKNFVLLIALLCFYYSSVAQDNKDGKLNPEDTVVVTGTELVPIGGRSEGLPKGLEGKWILQSGIKRTKPPVDVQEKKLENEKIQSQAAAAGNIPPSPITPAQSDNLHEPEKPSISFYGLNETFSGFTGCNKYSGRYHMKGKKLTLKNAAASTKMVCLGEYDEKAFLSTLGKVDSYRAKDGQLELLDGDEVVLVFRK